MNAITTELKRPSTATLEHTISSERPDSAMECRFTAARGPTECCVHMHASADHLAQLRRLVCATLCEAGVGPDERDGAVLALSELVSNAIRACGTNVPLLVAVNVKDSVEITVHDPEPVFAVPERRAALDDPDAESGRGLALLDVIAPGWEMHPDPGGGKHITCRILGI
ncbi:ATP-binding protein [Streptomyces sp. NPDC008343]|uniref:ATP-binding protein n=1 Tax=Streptomyces sp. NPDC008343 TaxID=3364828 RepID=UPI0036EB1C4C